MTFSEVGEPVDEVGNGFIACFICVFHSVMFVLTLKAWSKKILIAKCNRVPKCQASRKEGNQGDYAEVAAPIIAKASQGE